MRKIKTCLIAGLSGLALAIFTGPHLLQNPVFAAETPMPAANATQPVIPPLNAATAGNHETDKPSDANAEQWPRGKQGEAGKAYADGNFARARSIWEELAANGDGQAMNNLGVLYDQGKGVEPDTGRAMYWFSQAANAGNLGGMNNYGRFLEQGKGIAPNPEEAARWFDMAARQGQAEAQFNLGYLYEHGRGVPRDDTAAAAWYSRAATLNQKDAMARLGHLYRIGKGVPQNSQRAALLLYAGAMEGSAEAIAELERMAQETPVHGNAVLFGQKLDESSRKEMRESLRKAGASVKREENGHICDIYDVAKTVPGASDMAVCYSPADKLAFLKIDYPANDKARADAVLKMVESRFGPPTAGEGEDARIWNLGSIIVATQYAPAHRQMSLMYMVPKVYYQTRNIN